MALAAVVLTSTSPEDSMPTTAIVGRVQLAGKVIEHAQGYRAEHARVVEVLPIEGRGRLTESVAARFGVTVGGEIPAASLEAIMRSDRRRRRRSLRVIGSARPVDRPAEPTALVSTSRHARRS
jgi:hypothetical protein